MREGDVWEVNGSSSPKLCMYSDMSIASWHHSIIA
jgi:hypothetical protein